jgi:SAM-dependent methyltransferase
VHYARLASDIARLLERRSKPIVVDWGCGDALGAPQVAPSCGELILYDAVEAVQRRLGERFSGAGGNIRVLDTAGWKQLPDHSIDVIVLNSVAQYISRDVLGSLLDEFRRVLKPDGEAILADIIPPHVSMAVDIFSLLKSGWQHGFFLAACRGLVATFFSEYRKLRAVAGFSTYEESEFKALVAAHGFAVERLPRNLGFNQQRMGFRVRPI